MSKFSIYVSKIIVFILLFISFYAIVSGNLISVVVVREGVKYTIHNFDSLAFCFSLILLFFLFRFRAKSNTTKIYFLSAIFIVTIFVFCLLLKNPLNEDDAAIIFNEAQKVYSSLIDNGTFSLGTYFYKAPWQIGLLLFEVILCFLSFNNLEISLLIINIISILITWLYLHKINKMLFGETNMFVVLITAWIVPLFYIHYFYGWLIGLSLALISVYYFLRFIKDFNNIDIPIFVLFGIISSFIKPNFVIIFVAYIIVLFVIFLKKNKINIISTASVIISLFISLNISSLTMSLITGESVRGIPKIAYLTMGSQYGLYGNGWYNGYVDTIFYSNGEDYDLVSEVAKKDLAEQLNFFVENPRELISFYSSKANDLLLNKDYMIHQQYYSRDGENIGYNAYLQDSIVRDIIYSICQVSFNLIWIGTFAFCIQYVFFNGTVKVSMLLCLLYLGGFFYHLLFEAKSIYMFPWVTFLIPVSCLGYSFLFDSVNNKLSTTNRTLFCGLICAIIGSLSFGYLYNRRIILSPALSNYTYTDETLLLNNGTFITQNISVLTDTTMTGINIKTNGNLFEDGTICIEVWDGTSLISQSYFDESVLTDYDYVYFDIQDVDLKATMNYDIRIYSNLIDEEFGLCIGDANVDTIVNSFAINGFDQGKYLNFTVFSKINGTENYEYVYLGNAKE